MLENIKVKITSKGLEFEKIANALNPLVKHKKRKSVDDSFKRLAPLRQWGWSEEDIKSMNKRGKKKVTSEGGFFYA